MSERREIWQWLNWEFRQVRHIPVSAWRKFLICVFTHKGSSIDGCEICHLDYFPKDWRPLP